MAIHPTPWIYDDNREHHEGMVAVFDAEGTHIMSFGDMEDCTGQDIEEAMLFAAAPELLEALEALVTAIAAERKTYEAFLRSDSLEHGAEWEDAVATVVIRENEARAAITKARGE